MKLIKILMFKSISFFQVGIILLSKTKGILLWIIIVMVSVLYALSVRQVPCHYEC